MVYGKKPKSKVKAQERKVRRNVRRGAKAPRKAISRVNACIGGANCPRRRGLKDMTEKV